jgi:hypothetical protein
MGIAMKILKLFWQQRQDGAYAIVDMKGLDLLGPERSGQDFFAVRDGIVISKPFPERSGPSYAKALCRSSPWPMANRECDASALRSS